MCLHMHALLCIRRVVIAPGRTDSSCEELVSKEGSVPPTAHVWSRSGLAKYTAAQSLISAADISKQHKNVGAVPPLLTSPPSWNRPGLASKSARAVSREQVQSSSGPMWNTHTRVCTTYTYKRLSGVPVWEAVGCGFSSSSTLTLPSEL